MKSDTKLYAAVGLLVVLGGALFVTNKQQKEEAQNYTLAGQTADLPKINLTDADVKAIDKIVITKAPDGDGGAGTEVELAKKDDKWRVVRPVDAEANQTNVTSLLDNVKTLKVTEQIDPGKASYDQYKVSDGKALHAVFQKGGNTVFEAWFGENGGRGQMARLAGKDGVYAIKGYSSYLYDRETKGWRDTTFVKFDDKDVTEASVANEHGTYTFTRKGDDWTAKFKDAKTGVTSDIERFEKSKLEDMLRAYRSLNADGFADKGKTEADLGLDKPAATLVFTMKDGGKHEITVGATAEGSSRWAKASGFPELVSISSWAADWAMAEPKKFQKAEEKKDAKDDKAKPAPSPKPAKAG